MVATHRFIRLLRRGMSQCGKIFSKIARWTRHVLHCLGRRARPLLFKCVVWAQYAARGRSSRAMRIRRVEFLLYLSNGKLCRDKVHTLFVSERHRACADSIPRIIATTWRLWGLRALSWSVRLWTWIPAHFASRGRWVGRGSVKLVTVPELGGGSGQCPHRSGCGQSLPRNRDHYYNHYYNHYYITSLLPLLLFST